MYKLSKIHLVILSILVILLILGHILYGLRVYDDAYITYRYARNISSGLGFVYNPGRPVLGTTTPLFTLLLASINGFFGEDNLPLITFLANLILESINVILLFRIAAQIFNNPILAGIISLLYILHPLRFDVAAGGMETPLYLTFLLLTYDNFVIKKLKLPAATWAGLAFLTRPDSLIATLPVFLFWFLWDRAGFYKAMLIFVLVISPWIVFSLSYFGSLLPNTIAAKSVTYQNPSGHAFLFLITFFATGTLNIFLPMQWIVPGFIGSFAGIFIGSFKLVREKSLMVTWTCFPILYFIFMSLQNPAMWFPWYYLPLIPIGLISITAAFWFSSLSNANWRWIFVGILMIFIAVIPIGINHFYPSWDPDRQREAAYWEACRIVKSVVNARDVVLAPDIGVIGWCLDEAIILDPIGLVSPESLPYQQNLKPNQWISPELIDDFDPEFIISFDSYLKHARAESHILDDDYHLIWQKEYTIQQKKWTLLILEKKSDLDRILSIKSYPSLSRNFPPV